NTAVRAEAVVDTRMYEDPVRRLPHAACFDAGGIRNRAQNRRDAPVLRDERWVDNYGVVLDDPLAEVLNQPTDAGACRKRCAQAPGHAVRHSEFVRVAADHTARHTGELDVL